MSSPIDNEKAPGESGTRLPALGSPELSTDFLGRMKEILESLLGRRGSSNWDRAVTFRDLYHMGVNIGSMNGFGGPMAIELQGNPGALQGPVTASFAADFDRQLRGSAAYKELSRGIGSVDDLAMMPDEFRQILQHSLADVARQNRAAISTVERKVQTSAMSVASRLTEITAALDQAAAGVRKLDGAYADNLRALATSITQVTASLGNLGTVTVEEKFLAQADVNDGLLGQWSIKIQTGTDANPIIAGIALSAEGPNANETTSSLVFMADRFGFYTNNGTVLPFGIDGATGRIYLNGQLFVNAGGTTLDQMTAGMINFVGDFAAAPAVAGYRINDVYKNTTDGNSYILKLVSNVKTWTLFLQKGTSGNSAKGLAVSATSQIFQITKAGANAPGSITLTASAQNLAGTPNWTIPAGTATLSAGSDAYSKVLNFANMSTDTVTVQVSQDGLADTITIAKVREGSDAVTGLLTNESVTFAADSAGTVSSYGPGGGTFKVFDGTNDKTGDAAVVYSVASTYQASGTIAASGIYSVTGMTGDTGWILLRAVYKGITIDKVLSLAKSRTGSQGATGGRGSDGSRGNVNIAASSYSSWSDTDATNAVIAAGYGYPQDRDVVTLYGPGYSETRFRSSYQWLALAAYINGNMLVTGTLSASKLQGGTISGVDIDIGGVLKVTTSGTPFAQLAYPRLVRGNSDNFDAPGIQGFKASSSGTGPALVAEGSSSGNAINITAGVNGIVQTGGGTNWLRTTVANAQNSFDLGSTDFAWRTVYSYGGYVTVSDARLKDDIEPSALGLDFINALRPVSYRLALGHNKVIDHDLEGPPQEGQPLGPITELIPVPGKRRHYGLLAQEVRQALLEHGADDAAVWIQADPGNEESQQSLRYEELVSPLIRAVQELTALVAGQQQEINDLKGRLLSAGL